MRALVRALLAAFFLAAGIAHFAATDVFARIVPPQLPAPHAIVRVTGAIEIALALGVLAPRTRRVAGALLAAYCLAVLPANIHMALEQIAVGGIALPAWALWARVALQFPLIALILWATQPGLRLTPGGGR